MKELIFGLIGGTAILMYGVDKMGDGLEKACGKLMKNILGVLTGNVFFAFLVGTLLTALVQSSTAITVLTVGFVNAGLMDLSQAVGIIYGANVGTTITAQFMAFSFKLKLTEIALPVIGIGFFISYFVKNNTIKNVGNAIMGFGLMFFGLKILNGGIPIIQNSESLKYFFENYASIPIIGIALGAFATAMVHSSSATVGLVLVLAKSGLLGFKGALCIMLGDNIGTCITAQLASLTGNLNARRTAWAHTLYNVIGVVVVLILLNPFISLIEFITVKIQGTNDIGIMIANSHTVFNLLSAIVFLLLNKYYIKFLETIIKGKKTGEKGIIPLDRLLLDTPVVAAKSTLKEVVKALETSKKMIDLSMESFFKNDIEKLEGLSVLEEELNSYQKDITSYMVELSKRPLEGDYSKMVTDIIDCINNVQRIGDHTVDYSSKIKDKIYHQIKFSSDSLKEMEKLQSLINNMYELTLSNFRNYDEKRILYVKELEDIVDNLNKTMSDNHLERLKDGSCNVEAGVIFLDMLSHYERIADLLYHTNLTLGEELYNISKYGENKDNSLSNGVVEVKA